MLSILLTVGHYILLISHFTDRETEAREVIGITVIVLTVIGSGLALESHVFPLSPLISLNSKRDSIYW